MIWPFVPRFVYDDLKASHDALLDKYHALKVQGATAPRAQPPAATPPPIDPTERVLAEGRRQYVERVTAEYIGQGKAPSEARAIAEMLGDALDDLSPVGFS